MGQRLSFTSQTPAYKSTFNIQAIQVQLNKIPALSFQSMETHFSKRPFLQLLQHKYYSPRVDATRRQALPKIGQPNPVSILRSFYNCLLNSLLLFSIRKPSFCTNVETNAGVSNLLVKSATALLWRRNLQCSW